jgi:hypothetical protein
MLQYSIVCSAVQRCGGERLGKNAYEEGIYSYILLRTALRTNPGTEAEPQQIVAQRLLSCLQYPVP